MTKFELLQVIAVLLSPLIAVQVDKFLELILEEKKRKPKYLKF